MTVLALIQSRPLHQTNEESKTLSRQKRFIGDILSDFIGGFF